MATAIELLVGSRSEKGLWSHFGRWAIFISKKIDQLSQGGSAVPDYGWVKRGGSTLVGLTNGSFLEFNSVGPTRGISFANNRWTLNTSKTYRISLFGTFEGFSNANDLLEVKFTDDTGAPLQTPTADAPTAQWRPVTSTSQSSSGHGIEMIYQTPAAFSGLCIVRARIVTLTGSVNMPQNALTWIVEEILGGV